MQSVEEQIFQYEQRTIQDNSGKSSDNRILLLNKMEDLLYAMRSKQDQINFKYLFRGIIGFTLITAIMHIIFYGYWAGLAGLVLSSILYVFGNTKVKEAIVQLKRKKQNTESKNVQDRIMYLESGLDIKEIRLHVLRVLFSILLPFNFYMIAELVLGRLGAIQIFIAGIVGVITWLFLFQNDFQQIFEFDDKIEQLKEEAEKL